MGRGSPRNWGVFFCKTGFCIFVERLSPDIRGGVAVAFGNDREGTPVSRNKLKMVAQKKSSLEKSKLDLNVILVIYQNDKNGLP